jgi:hypothetical protein
VHAAKQQSPWNGGIIVYTFNFCFYLIVTLSTAGEIISWIAFVFLIIIGLESSRRFSVNTKTIEKLGVLEFLLRQRLLHPITGLGISLVLAVFVLFLKPFSTEWTVIVVIAYIFILYILIKKIMTAGAR